MAHGGGGRLGVAKVLGGRCDKDRLFEEPSAPEVPAPRCLLCEQAVKGYTSGSGKTRRSSQPARSRQSYKCQNHPTRKVQKNRNGASGCSSAATASWRSLCPRQPSRAGSWVLCSTAGCTLRGSASWACCLALPRV